MKPLASQGTRLARLASSRKSQSVYPGRASAGGHFPQVRRASERLQKTLGEQLQEQSPRVSLIEQNSPKVQSLRLIQAGAYLHPAGFLTLSDLLMNAFHDRILLIRSELYGLEDIFGGKMNAHFISLK